MSSLLWQLWSDEWLLYEKVSFNGDEKSIYVHPDVVDFDIRVDLWSAWVRWRAAGNDVYELAMRRTGFDLLPGGDRTGDIYFLINGWKLYLELEQVKVTGVLFSDDFDTAYYDESTRNAVYPVKVSALVNTVSGGAGGGGATPAEIWSYGTRTLTAAPTYNGPTAVQIRQEMDANSIKLAQIKAILDSMNIPTVVQIRQEMDANSTKLEEISNKTDDALTKTEFLALQ